MDLEAIFRALAEQIRKYLPDGWNVSPFPFSGMPLDLVEVWPGDEGDFANYHESFGGGGYADIYCTLRVQVSAGDAETAFKKMTRVLAAGSAHGSSVHDAVMSDRTLGGVVSDCVVLTARWNPNADDLSTVAFLPVRLLVKKSGAAA